MAALTPLEVSPGVREHVIERFVVGVDLGQSMDPTAICVMQHRAISHMTFKGNLRQVGEQFDVRHLERLALGLSYPEQLDAVAQLLARQPLRNARNGCQLVIDESGVGRAVGDLFEAARMEPLRVTITAGLDETWVGPRRFHVAKQILISTLDARLHTGELRFAADLQEAGTMAEELKDFRRKVSAAGRYSYDARVGKHDDLVLACALALWAVTRPKPPVAATGFYRRR